jgi:UDP-glucuronate decarboxylase
MAKRILVTGGAGFLGSHLCERLINDGHEVICVDDLFTGSRHNLVALLTHRRFEFVRHDVCQSMHIDCDEIFHLACPASPIHYQRNPVRTIRTCVQGTLNVLDLAREVGARIMIASTSEVYGDPLAHPQVETYWGNVNPIGPRACYDEGKRCAEALAASYSQQYEVAVRIARIFNTYGPRMLPNDGRVVSNFVVQSLRSEAITLFGDGSQSRSFCYVDDLIEGFIRLMKSDESQPVNLGNPSETTIKQLAEKIRGMIASDSPLVFEPLPQDDPTRRRPDITRAREKLGWEPKIDLEAGLRATIDYFRTRLAAGDVLA